MESPSPDDDGDNTWYCKPCDLNYTCNADLQEHKWSIIHHIKLEQTENFKEHVCKLCHIKATSLVHYTQHIKGKKHKNNVDRFRRKNEKEYRSSDSPSTSKPKKEKKREKKEKSAHRDGDQQFKKPSGLTSKNPTEKRKRREKIDTLGSEKEDQSGSSTMDYNTETESEKSFSQRDKDQGRERARSSERREGHTNSRERWNRPQSMDRAKPWHNRNMSWNKRSGPEAAQNNRWGGRESEPPGDSTRKSRRDDRGSWQQQWWTGPRWDQGEGGPNEGPGHPGPMPPFFNNHNNANSFGNPWWSFDQEQDDPTMYSNNTINNQSNTRGDHGRPNVISGTGERNQKSVSFDIDIEKKADNNSAVKTKDDELTPQRKDTLNMSLKASKIIDDILNKTGAVSSKTVTNSEKSKDKEAEKEKDKGAEILSRAEKLCADIREKRELAKLSKEAQEQKRKDEEQSALDKEINTLTDRAMSKIRGYVSDDNTKTTGSFSNSMRDGSYRDTNFTNSDRDTNFRDINWRGSHFKDTVGRDNSFKDSDRIDSSYRDSGRKDFSYRDSDRRDSSFRDSDRRDSSYRDSDSSNASRFGNYSGYEDYRWRTPNYQPPNTSYGDHSFSGNGPMWHRGPQPFQYRGPPQHGWRPDNRMGVYNGPPRPWATPRWDGQGPNFHPRGQFSAQPDKDRASNLDSQQRSKGIKSSSSGSEKSTSLATIGRSASLPSNVQKALSKHTTRNQVSVNIMKALKTRLGKQSGDKLTKDNLMRLVNAPRSHKERMQVAKMLQSHSRLRDRVSARPKLNLHSTATQHQPETAEDLEADADADAEALILEDLPDDVREQIAQLINEEMGCSIVPDGEDSDKGVMDIGELMFGADQIGDILHIQQMDTDLPHVYDEPQETSTPGQSLHSSLVATGEAAHTQSSYDLVAQDLDGVIDLDTLDLTVAENTPENTPDIPVRDTENNHRETEERGRTGSFDDHLREIPRHRITPEKPELSKSVKENFGLSSNKQQRYLPEKLLPEILVEANVGKPDNESLQRRSLEEEMEQEVSEEEVIMGKGRPEVGTKRRRKSSSDCVMIIEEVSEMDSKQEQEAKRPKIDAKKSVKTESIVMVDSDDEPDVVNVSSTSNHDLVHTPVTSTTTPDQSPPAISIPASKSDIKNQPELETHSDTSVLHVPATQSNTDKQPELKSRLDTSVLHVPASQSNTDKQPELESRLDTSVLHVPATQSNTDNQPELESHLDTSVLHVPASQSSVDSQPELESRLDTSVLHVPVNQSAASIGEVNEHPANEEAHALPLGDPSFISNQSGFGLFAAPDSAVDQVLEISLREEELHQKLQETDRAIDKLQALLAQTHQQLKRRMNMKEKLLKEEEELRTKRIKILKGAIAERKTPTSSVVGDPPGKNDQPSTGDLTEVTSLDTSHLTSDWDSTSTVFPTECDNRNTKEKTKHSKKGNRDLIVNTASGVKVKDEPISPKETVLDSYLEPDTTGVDNSLSGLVSMKEECIEQEERNKQLEAAKQARKVKPRFKSYSFSMGENEVRSALLSPTRTQPMGEVPELSGETSEDGSGIMATYVGTLEMDGVPDGNVLKKLAANLAHMQKTPYVFVTEDELCSENESKKTDITSSQEHIPDLFSEPLTESKKKTDVDSSQEHIPDLFSEPQMKEKKKTPSSPKKVTKVVDTSNLRRSPRCKTRSDTKSEFAEPYAVKQDKTDEVAKSSVAGSDNIKSKKKTSEVSPEPSSPKMRRRKPKKLRDQTSTLTGITVVDSSSDSCLPEEEDENDSSSNARQNRKRKGKKGAKSATAKIVQEYLHAESSSDVEIEGLQAKGTLTRRGRSKRAANVKKEQRQIETAYAAPNKKMPSEQNVDSGKKYVGHTGMIHCMTIWDKWLLTGSEDHTVRKFNLETCECEHVYKGHTKGVQCLLVTNAAGGNTRLYTGSFDNSVSCYSFESGEKILMTQYAHRVHCFCEAFGNLYIGLGNGNIICMGLSKRSKDMFKCSDSPIRCIAAGREGGRNLLCVASNDCSITIRDARSSLLIRTLEGHTKTPMDMKVIDHLVYTAGADKTIQVHNLNTGDSEKYINNKGVMTAVDVYNNLLVTAGFEGIIKCYNKKDYSQLQQYYGAGKGPVSAMLLHKDKIYSGGKEGQVEVVTLNTEAAYICKFRSCGLVFGVVEHLSHHLLKDHILPNQANTRCLWEQCSQYVPGKQDIEATLEHIQQHMREYSST